jgi:hypothetical protein
VFGNPRAVASSVLAPISRPFENIGTLGFVGLYSVFLVIVYVGIATIGALLAEIGAERR